MKRLLKRLFCAQWKVARSGWPYPEGYCTYKRSWGRTTILDTGLTKQQAEEACRELNS